MGHQVEPLEHPLEWVGRTDTDTGRSTFTSRAGTRCPTRRGNSGGGPSGRLVTATGQKVSFRKTRTSVPTERTAVTRRVIDTPDGLPTPSLSLVALEDSGLTEIPTRKEKLV